MNHIKTRILKIKKRNAFLVFAFAFCLLSGRTVWALRIISLLPSNTEIVESLGAGDQIVGVTIFDEPRPHRAVVGDFMTPSMEEIVALKPDLILAGAWKSSRIVSQLQSMGYRVVDISNPRSFADIYDSIRTIAAAIGKPEAAGPVIADMKKRVLHLQEKTRPWTRHPQIYVEIDRPDWTVGGNDFITEAVTLCGGQNIFSDLKAQASQVSWEVIVERNPDIILSLEAKKDEIQRRTGWESIRAVQQGWIIDDLKHKTLSHPSPRILDAMEELSDRMSAFVHP